MVLLEHAQGIDQGLDLNDKLRGNIKFTEDPKPLTYKRPSQLKIELAYYVGRITTTENLGGHSGKSITF